jgi:hypothetical protein
VGEFATALAERPHLKGQKPVFATLIDDGFLSSRTQLEKAFGQYGKNSLTGSRTQDNSSFFMRSQRHAVTAGPMGCRLATTGKTVSSVGRTENSSGSPEYCDYHWLF